MLDGKNQHLIDKVISVIDKWIQLRVDTKQPIGLSEMIMDEVNADYYSLKDLLQSSKGLSLDDLITLRNLEKVKELLVYTDTSLAEIAYSLGFISPANLSNQLEKYTGFTVSNLQQIRQDKLKLIAKRFNERIKEE